MSTNTKEVESNVSEEIKLLELADLDENYEEMDLIIERIYALVQRSVSLIVS